jgi:hypothetical protein
MKSASTERGLIFRISARAALPNGGLPVHQTPSVSKRGDLSQQARDLWVFLQDQGGWWTAGELSQRLVVPETSPYRSASLVGRWLSALTKRQHIAVNPIPSRVKRFGVTGRCIPISGYSMLPGNPTGELHTNFLDGEET